MGETKTHSVWLEQSERGRKVGGEFVRGRRARSGMVLWALVRSLEFVLSKENLLESSKRGKATIQFVL